MSSGGRALDDFLLTSAEDQRGCEPLEGKGAAAGKESQHCPFRTCLLVFQVNFFMPGLSWNNCCESWKRGRESPLSVRYGRKEKADSEGWLRGLLMDGLVQRCVWAGGTDKTCKVPSN